MSTYIIQDKELLKNKIFENAINCSIHKQDINNYLDKIKFSDKIELESLFENMKKKMNMMSYGPKTVECMNKNIKKLLSNIQTKTNKNNKKEILCDSKIIEVKKKLRRKINNRTNIFIIVSLILFFIILVFVFLFIINKKNNKQ